MTRCLFAVFILLFAASARAQSGKMALSSSDGRHEVAISAGAFRPTSHFAFGGANERFGSTGFMFILDYLHALNKAVGAGVEGMYINRGSYQVRNMDFAAQFPGATSRVRGDTKAVLAILRLKLPGDGFRPYVLGGAGFQHTTMDLYMQAPPYFYWGAGFGEEIAAVQGAASGAIFALRTGIEKTYPEGGLLGVEVGWIGIASQRYARTRAGAALGMSDVTTRGDGLSITAKFGYRFGGGS